MGNAPHIFLEFVRRTYEDRTLARRQSTGIKDPAFAEIVRNELEELGENVRAAFEVNALDAVVSDLSREIVNELTPSDQRRIQQLVAIGGIDHGGVNAACFKSEHGSFAIVVHYGLMVFLHKLTKLTVAAVRPETVTYCNRDNPQRLTTMDYLQYVDDIVNYYRATGEVARPMLKLNAASTSAAGWLLRLMEAFVVSHEIAHFLCGHLDEDSSFMSDPDFPSLEVFKENRNHVAEFEADAKAFELLRSYAQREGRSARPEDLAVALIGVLEALRLTGPRGVTASHPSPTERKLFVIDRYFDAESARRLREWLHHPELGVPRGLKFA